MHAAILGLGTALPPYRVTQAEAGEWLMNHIDYPDRTRRFADRIFRMSVIDTRHSVLPDFTESDEPTLYRGDGLPPLEDRMVIFGREAPRLAAIACRRAMANSQLRPNQITHLIVVTSTGFFTPGPDVDLAASLGLAASVERTVVGMAGCSGAFTGLRVARAITASNTKARVLMVCIEISSIHFDNEPDHDKIVAYSLFGDSAAAAIIGTSTGLNDTVGILGPQRSELLHSGRELLRWDLTSKGFSLHLSEDLAPLLAEHVSAFAEPFIAAAMASRGNHSRIQSWIVHPGGPSVLNAVQNELNLTSESLTSSWNVLRSAGNLSSASILFVLEEERRRRHAGDDAILLGFGPGLTLEALNITHGDRELATFSHS